MILRYDLWERSHVRVRYDSSLDKGHEIQESIYEFRHHISFCRYFDQIISMFIVSPLTKQLFEV